MNIGGIGVLFKENRTVSGRSEPVISAAASVNLRQCIACSSPFGRPRRSARILLNAMGGVSGARWQSEDQLHLTLRFIGEVDRHRGGDIHAALGAASTTPRSKSP